MSTQSPLPTSTSPRVARVSSSLPPELPIPSFTPYGAPRSNHTPSSSVLNYYFLLIALFVVIIIIAYYSLVRRRRRRQAHNRSGGQTALARDLETRPGAGRQMGREEGLDERGEAPPPYLPKELEAAVLRGEAVELHGGSREEMKPPDYQEVGDRR